MEISILGENRVPELSIEIFLFSGGAYLGGLLEDKRYRNWIGYLRR